MSSDIVTGDRSQEGGTQSLDTGQSFVSPVSPMMSWLHNQYGTSQVMTLSGQDLYKAPSV